MGKASERQRRYRERLRTGRRVMSIEIDFDTLPDVLARGGYLDPLLVDDPKCVRRAIEEMLNRMAAAEIRDA